MYYHPTVNNILTTQPAEVDLHIHSTFSDGSWSPQRIGDYAQRNRIKAISITDHNTIEGNEELKRYFEKTKRRKSPEIINGVEITTKLKDNKFHLLAYMYNNTAESKNILEKQFTKIRETATKRKDKIIKNLQDLGFRIDVNKLNTDAYDDYLIGSIIVQNNMNIKQLENYGIRTKKEFLKEIDLKIKTYLKHRYNIKDLDQYFKKLKHIDKKDRIDEPCEQFFKKFLKKGCEYYIPKDRIEFRSIKKGLKNTNALLVIAHPSSRYIGLDKDTLQDLINRGIDGIEGYSISSNVNYRKWIERFAKRNNLFLTGGTDFHNKNSPYIPGSYNPHNRLNYKIIKNMKRCWKNKYN